VERVRILGLLSYPTGVGSCMSSRGSRRFLYSHHCSYPILSLRGTTISRMKRVIRKRTKRTKTAKTMKVMIESSTTRVPKNMTRPELVRKIDVPGRRRERQRLTKIRIRRGRIYRHERFLIRGCMPEWTGRYVARPKVIGFLFLCSNSCSIVRSLPRQELRLF
jgi:hypothetical protein